MDVSRHAASSLFWIGCSSKKPFYLRLWLALHASPFSWCIVVIPSSISFVWLLGTSLGSDFIVVLTFYHVIITSKSFLLFFPKNWNRLRNMMLNMEKTAREIESDQTEEEVKISRKGMTVLRKLTRYVYIAVFFQGLGLVTLPVQDEFLPPPLRNSSIFGDPAKLMAQALSSFGCGVIALSCSHYIVLQIAATFYEQTCFTLLAYKVRTTLNEEQLKKYIKMHGDLLAVSRERDSIFAVWNFIYLNGLGVASIFCTIGVIDEVAPVSFALLGPVTLSVALVLCTLGDMIQQGSLQVCEAAYNNLWYLTEKSFRNMINLMILRANKPCLMTASAAGSLSFPLFVTFINNYYRFVQVLLNLN